MIPAFGLKKEKRSSTVNDEGPATLYQRNLNTHKSYRNFRLARAELRDRDKPLDSLILSKFLDNYAETGEELDDQEEQELPALIPLIGFVSTSLDRQAAEEFAWSNPDAGIEATLFMDGMLPVNTF